MKITIIISNGTKSECQIEIEILEWMQIGAYSALEALCIKNTLKPLNSPSSFS